jgi:hypothetical protein
MIGNIMAYQYMRDSFPFPKSDRKASSLEELIKTDNSPAMPVG